jgi:hypothetical protein
MLTTKIRTTILALAAVAALSATGAPLASAQQNTSTVSDDTCQQWLKWFEEDLKHANEGVTAKNPGQVTKGYGEAAHDLQLASDAHCSWASTAIAHGTPPRAVTVMAHLGTTRIER